MKGLIFAIIACIAVASGKKIHYDFPEHGEKCVISDDIFWRSEKLSNPNQYYFCSNKKVYIGHCPKNHGFLQTGDRNCSHFSTWDCLKSTVLQLTCERSTDGSLVNVNNPNSYGYCFDGKPYSHHDCPYGYGFVNRMNFVGCASWKNWNKYTECF